MEVTVWNEGLHERTKPAIAHIYPEGIHGAIAEGLLRHLPSATIRTATMDEIDHGLSPDVLGATDVLLWWGHMAHDQVRDAIVAKVRDRVLGGMGLIVLHSGHYSKLFMSLMGTSCSLEWRNEGERELVWTATPGHPIAAGIVQPIVIAEQEMYGEPFDIPNPDDVVFISSFAGGEVFRSGVTFQRGRGRIFYFSPGDEEYPVYRDPQIQRVLANAVRWVTPSSPIEKGPIAVNAPRRDFSLDEAG